MRNVQNFNQNDAVACVDEVRLVARFTSTSDGERWGSKEAGETVNLQRRRTLKL